MLERLLSFFRRVRPAKKAPKVAEVEDLEELAALEIGGAELPATPPESGGKESIDKYFTKMESKAPKTEVDLKDIIGAPVLVEDPKVKAAEKDKEKATIEAASKDKGGAMSSLFDQDDGEENTTTAGLIAALPDVTIGELLSNAYEVKALMEEWQRRV